MTHFRFWGALAALLLAAPAALAQSGTANSIPYWLGQNVTGQGEVGPCASGELVAGNTGSAPSCQSGASLGYVTGPASATDNAVARFDGTTGKLIQNSVVIVTDGGNISGVGDFTAGGAAQLGSLTITTPLGVASGGTGLGSGTSGGILGFTAPGTLASSAALGANQLVLGGGAGATPTTLGSLGATTTVLHGNAAGAPTFGAVALTTDVSGRLPVTNGGTGLDTVVQGDTFYADGANSIARLAKDTNATRYWANTGPSNNPTWDRVDLSSGVIGDLPFSNIAQIATSRILGRTTAATGDIEALTGTQATALLDAFVGDSGSGGTKGLVPAPAAGDAAAGKFLKADGAWTVPSSSLGSAIASFYVHKNSTDQSGIADATFTQITWSTEAYDVGGYFASNTWTPPSGKVRMTFAFVASGTIASGNVCAAAIYKNGSLLHQMQLGAMSNNTCTSFVTIDDSANGTDAYTTYAYVDLTSGTATVSGGNQQTFFMGSIF